MWKWTSVLFLAVATAAAQQGPLQSMAQPARPATFHAGTRLVEVEVVVRDQPVRPPGAGAWFAWALDSGPPFGAPGDVLKGLAKDDFTLLDQGKPQQIAVFRAGSIGAGSSDDAKPIVLPPGAVSNRQDNRGQPLNGATAVVVDLLNTHADYLGYARVGMTKLLHSLTRTDSRIALYTLGENLHILHDFTDDPQKLAELTAKLEQPHAALPAGVSSALADFGDLLTVEGDEVAQIAAGVHGEMTVRALKLIIQHLAGVPGRKSLVWLIDIPWARVPPSVMAMMQQANIVFYPVVVRAVGCYACPHVELETEHAAEALAAATGGRAFFDAMDLTFAVRATEQDSSTAYVLGYYPAEDTLDGKYHTITVKLHGKAPGRQPLEVHYRPGYLATKAAVPAPSPTLRELFQSRLNSAGIGLVAQAIPEAEHPGLYDVRVTVDLHDIHLDRRDGHFIGAFDLSVPNPSSKGSVQTANVSVDLTDKQLAEVLENGGTVTLTGVESESGEIRVVVRDRATGIAGSLRVPVEKP